MQRRSKLAALTLSAAAALVGAGPSLDDAQPVVIRTDPVAGTADVDPGMTELKVTFSKPMTDGNWSWAQVSDETFPKVTGKPHYAADGRTCVLPVKLEPDHFYMIWLNEPPFTNFADRDGHKAVRYQLGFHTRK